MKEFGKGGFSIVVLENMKSDDVTQLKADYSRIDGVEEVLNLEDVLDPTVRNLCYQTGWRRIYQIKMRA